MAIRGAKNGRYGRGLGKGSVSGRGARSVEGRSIQRWGSLRGTAWRDIPSGEISRPSERARVDDPREATEYLSSSSLSSPSAASPCRPLSAAPSRTTRTAWRPASARRRWRPLADTRSRRRREPSRPRRRRRSAYTCRSRGCLGRPP